MDTAKLLETHPARDTFDLVELAAAIDACATSAVACSICADSCLSSNPPMTSCVRICLDAADIARTTAQILSRPAPSGDAWEHQIRACISACNACVAECGEHDDAHCHNCATAAKSCVDALTALLAVAS